MFDEYQKLFDRIELPEPRLGLFDRIILTIKREQELRQTKKLLFGFVAMFLISLSAIPFSSVMLINQIKNSGIFYFIFTAFSDFGTFLGSWQNFGLAILESLPITGLIAFIVSLGLAVFTLRLFLYKKRILFGYLKQSFSFS